ncbi:MAG: DegQ family serine endoprotease [Deltaproteobacteria bacterium]|nr:DegQ family serine endoprotease [Deltaproteobacteria bacterium]MBW2111633.1 DegQ family serine endoprotease [Deltaproteobacteria bacterium]MBW2352755.1 DegQ family serine endoprotease [Deltaproteobacteria bacterium]HDZ91517.1 DegQ family serine endoprotease [Deltaproteobacteria bacterium]
MGWTLFSVAAVFAFASLIFGGPGAVAQTSPLLPGAPGSFSQLVKKARPSVVNISTVMTVKGPLSHPFGFQGPSGEDPLRDFFDRFFGDRMPKGFKQRNLGSGFIIDEHGYILTNNHVVEKADEITVKLAGGASFSAKVTGRDPKTDLALIQIDTDKPLTPLPMGDSDELEVGDWVIAMGNPFGLDNTVTAGIVSAKYRHIGAGPYENFIQTDASINPGNSGGPLLNSAGEVIGINTAIFSRSGGSIGIGFAIPINMAKQILAQLKAGKVIRGWLGVMIQKITPELKAKLNLRDTKGALVADVTPGGPAEKAGIKRGDVIVSFNGTQIDEMKDLPYMVASTPVGATVPVEVVRKGRNLVFKAKIGELKEDEKGPQESSGTGQRFGMKVDEITPQLAKEFGLSQTTGLVIVEVDRNSPAGEAGLRPGDVVLEIDQAPVRDLADFLGKTGRYKRGDTVLFLIRRGNSTLYLTLTVSGSSNDN